MIPSQFSEGFPGRLVEATDALGNRGHAFIPDDLPPSRDFGDRQLRIAVSEADQALARLGGMAREVERPDLLFRNFLRREAVLSSKIEGTHTTLADLILFEAAHTGSGNGNGDDAIVANYLEAFDYGRQRSAVLPLGRRMFCEMHAILMKGTDPREKAPGLLRDCLVVIGQPPIQQARFVPPPEIFVPELLENLQTYIQEYEEPLLVKLAVAHYQFETIHPFRDGNGRLGRLLISLALQKAGILTEPLLYLSAYLEQQRDEYYDALLRVSTHSDWVGWISFFLQGVKTQSLDAIARLERVDALRKDYHNRLTGPRVTQNIHRLIDELFQIPVLSVPGACAVTGLTYPAAKALIDRLVSTKVLDTETIVVRGTTYYFADELMRTLEGPLPVAET